MTVWILFTGTEHEDHGVSDVYASKEEAIKGAEEYMKADELPDYGTWEKRPPWRGDATEMWARGYDRIWITPYKVLGTPVGDTKESK